MEGELHLEGSVKATKRKLTWLPNIEDQEYTKTITLKLCWWMGRDLNP